jgi:hypothetical protein
VLDSGGARTNNSFLPPKGPPLKKVFAGFLLGLVVGGLAVYYGLEPARDYLQGEKKIPPEPSSVCYACFWEGYEPKLRADLIAFYQQFQSPDPMVMADVRYILWRATGTENCEARASYRAVARRDPDLGRRLRARALLGFSGAECGRDALGELQTAGALAREAGMAAQASALEGISRREFRPQFGAASITAELSAPAGATAVVLGESRIELKDGMRVGAQVDRVARDWVSYQMRWEMTYNPLPLAAATDYHEGAVARRMMELGGVQVYPLAGTLLARDDKKWFAPDEGGVFRFEVLPDKLMYPTTHVMGALGWLEDTHGINSIVGQAVGRRMEAVLGCGDSGGKMEAAFHLAQKGIHVIMPGDRFIDLLLGYEGPGVILGTAPVKHAGESVIVGGQPVRFSLREPILVEDTQRPLPVLYYDSAARYFRRLTQAVHMNVEYVEVDGSIDIDKLLTRAAEKRATALALRVATEYEYQQLKAWLSRSPEHRAILFHSGLYPYAQPLFQDFPKQVTFGDPRPRFE